MYTDGQLRGLREAEAEADRIESGGDGGGDKESLSILGAGCTRCNAHAGRCDALLSRARVSSDTSSIKSRESMLSMHTALSDLSKDRIVVPALLASLA